MNEMTNLFKLLELGAKAADDVCNNPTKQNCKKLEQITQLTQNELQKAKADRSYIEAERRYKDNVL